MEVKNNTPINLPNDPAIVGNSNIPAAFPPNDPAINIINEEPKEKAKQKLESKPFYKSSQPPLQAAKPPPVEPKVEQSKKVENKPKKEEVKKPV